MTPSSDHIEPAAGSTVDAGLHLLDRQVCDREGRLLCKVDDLELQEAPGEPPAVVAILVGPPALGRRLGGVVGRLVCGVHHRMVSRPDKGPLRIPFTAVRRFRSSVELSVTGDELELGELEAWLRVHVVARIPGADHAAG